MTSYADTAVRPADRARGLLAAETALWVGAATCVAFTLVWFLAALTPDGEPFRHTADYWYTGLGLPMVTVPLVVLPALRALQHGRDGRLGLAGTALTSAACVVFFAMLAYGLVAGVASSWGPTYVLCTLASVVGVWLFCAGSLRARLLPRLQLVLWGVAWTVGGMLGPEGSQLLLAVAYVALALALRRRDD